MPDNTPLYEMDKDFKNLSPLVRPGRIWEKLLPGNIPRSIKYPEIPVHSIGREAARKYPHNLAIYHVEEDRKYTYLELMYYADKIAAGLSDLGVKKGDGVGIYMTNSPEFIFTVYAISLNGAIAVPINPLLKASDIKHIINDSGIIKLLVCSSNLHPIIEEVLKETRIEKIVIH